MAKGARKKMWIFLLLRLFFRIFAVRLAKRDKARLPAKSHGAPGGAI